MNVKLNIVLLGLLFAYTNLVSGSKCPQDANSPYIVCYYDGRASLKDIDVGNCTHLIFTEAVTKDEDNTLRISKEDKNNLWMVKEARDNPLTVFTLTLEEDECWSILKSQNKSKYLINEITNFLQESRFDGVELNFKFGRKSGTSKDYFSLFVKSLSVALNSQHRRTKRESYDITEKQQGDATTTEYSTSPPETKKNESIVLEVTSTESEDRMETEKQVYSSTETEDEKHETSTPTKMITMTSLSETTVTKTISKGNKEFNKFLLIIRLPIYPDIVGKNFDLKALSRHADILSVPTHNIINEKEKFITYHPSRLMGLSDAFNTDSILDFLLGMGAEKSKIVLSFPAGVLEFQLATAGQNTPGSPFRGDPRVLGQPELCFKFHSGNWTLERDEDLTAPYAYSGNEWLAFEDEISVSIKGKYILLRELAGGAIYPIDSDVNDESCTNRTGTKLYLTGILHDNFKTLGRKPRALVLNSLQDEIHNTAYSGIEGGIKVSEYRIVRVVDHSGIVHVIRKNTKTEFECSRQGYFSHPLGCNKFYRCVKFNQYTDDFTVFEYNCPAGLAFDERWEVCVWPGSLPKGAPCTGSSEIAPVPSSHYQCPSYEGYYGDPENCRWFFACLDHARDGITPLTAYEFRCPFGLVFNEQKLACDWPWLVGACGTRGNAGHVRLQSGLSSFINGGNLEASLGQYTKPNEEEIFGSYGRDYFSAFDRGHFNENGRKSVYQSNEKGGIDYIASQFNDNSNRAPFASLPDYQISGGRILNKGGVILEENVNIGNKEGYVSAASFGSEVASDFVGNNRGNLQSFDHRRVAPVKEASYGGGDRNLYKTPLFGGKNKEHLSTSVSAFPPQESVYPQKISGGKINFNEAQYTTLNRFQESPSGSDSGQFITTKQAHFITSTSIPSISLAKSTPALKISQKHAVPQVPVLSRLHPLDQEHQKVVSIVPSTKRVPYFLPTLNALTKGYAVTEPGIPELDYTQKIRFSQKVNHKNDILTKQFGLKSLDYGEVSQTFGSTINGQSDYKQFESSNAESLQPLNDGLKSKGTNSELSLNVPKSQSVHMNQNYEQINRKKEYSQGFYEIPTATTQIPPPYRYVASTETVRHPEVSYTLPGSPTGNVKLQHFVNSNTQRLSTENTVSIGTATAKPIVSFSEAKSTSSFIASNKGPSDTLSSLKSKPTFKTNLKGTIYEIDRNVPETWSIPSQKEVYQGHDQITHFSIERQPIISLGTITSYEPSSPKSSPSSTVVPTTVQTNNKISQFTATVTPTPLVSVTTAPNFEQTQSANHPFIKSFISTSSDNKQSDVDSTITPLIIDHHTYLTSSDFDHTEHRFMPSPHVTFKSTIGQDTSSGHVTPPSKNFLTTNYPSTTEIPANDNVVHITPKAVPYQHETFENDRAKTIIQQTQPEYLTARPEIYGGSDDYLGAAEMDRYESDLKKGRITPRPFSTSENLFSASPKFDSHSLTKSLQTTTMQPIVILQKTKAFSNRPFMPLFSEQSISDKTINQNEKQILSSKISDEEPKPTKEILNSHLSTDIKGYERISTAGKESSANIFSPSTEEASTRYYTQFESQKMGKPRENIPIRSTIQLPVNVYLPSGNAFDGNRNYTLKAFPSMPKNGINPNIEIPEPPTEYILNHNIYVSNGPDFAKGAGAHHLKEFDFDEFKSHVKTQTNSERPFTPQTIISAGIINEGKEAEEILQKHSESFGQVISSVSDGPNRIVTKVINGEGTGIINIGPEGSSTIRYDVSTKETTEKAKERQYHGRIISELAATNKYEEYEIERSRGFGSSKDESLSSKTTIDLKNIKIDKNKKTVIVVSQVSDTNPVLVGKLAGQCRCQSNLLELKNNDKKRKNPEYAQHRPTDNTSVNKIQGNKVNEDAVTQRGMQLGIPFHFGNYDSPNLARLLQTASSLLPNTVMSATPKPRFDNNKFTSGRKHFRGRARYLSPSSLISDRYSGGSEPFSPAAASDVADYRVEKSTIQNEVEDRSSVYADFAVERYGPGGWRSFDETLQGSVDCKRPGLFRHPKHCNKFYACNYDPWMERFTLHIFNCPIRLTYDSSISACNWPVGGPACAYDNLLV